MSLRRSSLPTFFKPYVSYHYSQLALFFDCFICKARQLYLDSYTLLRKPFANGSVGNLLMVISDAFQPLSYWNRFMKGHSYSGVALDHHSYDVFSNAAVAKSYNQHINVGTPLLVIYTKCCG